MEGRSQNSVFPRGPGSPVAKKTTLKPEAVTHEAPGSYYSSMPPMSLCQQPSNANLYTPVLHRECGTMPFGHYLASGRLALALGERTRIDPLQKSPVPPMQQNGLP